MKLITALLLLKISAPAQTMEKEYINYKMDTVPRIYFDTTMFLIGDTATLYWNRYHGLTTGIVKEKEIQKVITDSKKARRKVVLSKALHSIWLKFFLDVAKLVLIKWVFK